jgi:DNA polymerase
MDKLYKDELTEAAVLLTGMENPSSVAQIKEWLMEQEGLEVASLNKKVIADVVAQLTTDKAKQFMALRKELAKSSTKKYDAMVRAACEDEHGRGCFQFYGAGRTGRWAGRLIQLQNLSKNKMSDIDACRSLVKIGDYETVKLLYGSVTSCLSELVRTALIPEDGHRFIVCDYSAIEARVLSWIAGEEWALEEFRGDGLIYEATGARMFGVPKHSIAKGGENHHLRQSAKTAELACGYGGGMGAMKAFGADKMGMSDEEIVRAVDLWREAHPNVQRLWKALEKAAIRCVVHGTEQVSTVGNIRFRLEKGILWMVLPSGRSIAYFDARYGRGNGRFTTGKQVLSYMGREQNTGRWTRLETFSGKITENLVQATARDCLRDAMLALTDAGFRIVAHIHDEVIISEPRDGRTLEDVAEIMGREIPWAKGLPLRGDGYYCDYYIKD